ncbi:unnamed protein product [Brachionus calyciflorus]|uniref:G-protein coupled receptors family 1 profile domain-containing protein n=1 Tax=Brachionus calyciflorus TaxID=104777 RepID=A0A813Y2X4_9BILA|nr:unnamed protein product [Brachionus calyciflorus]
MSMINYSIINSTKRDNTRNDYLLPFYIISILGLVMVFVGLVTNTLNLLVLTRKTMKSTTNKYLSALAICDLFVLIFSQLSVSNNILYDITDSSNYYLPYIINDYSNTVSNLEVQNFSLNDHILKMYHKWVYYVHPKIYPFIYPIAIMFQICTVLINLGMSTDRFVAIHLPLKSLNFCTIKYAKRVIAFIFIFSFLYSLPRFFEFYVHIEKVIMINDTYEIIHYDFTSIGKSSIFRQIVYVYMYMLFQSVLPLIFLSIINVALLISLKKSRKKLRKFSVISERSHLSSTKSNSLKINNKDYSKKKDITLMMITVVILFIILQSPAVMCNCFYGSNNYRAEFSRKEPNSLNILCQVGNFFILTSSSTNFFTYCLFNKKFRRELMRFFRRVICRKPNLKNMRRFSATTMNSFLLHTSNQFKNSTKCNSIKISTKRNLKTNDSNHVKNLINSNSRFFLKHPKQKSCHSFLKQKSCQDSNVIEFSLMSAQVSNRKPCLKNTRYQSIDSFDIIKFSIRKNDLFLDNDFDSSLVYV